MSPCHPRGATWPKPANCRIRTGHGEAKDVVTRAPAVRRAPRGAPPRRRTPPPPPPTPPPAAPAASARPIWRPCRRGAGRRQVDRAAVDGHRQPAQPGTDQRSRPGRHPGRPEHVAHHPRRTELLRMSGHGQRERPGGEHGQGQQMQQPARPPGAYGGPVQLGAVRVHAGGDRGRGEQRGEHQDRDAPGVAEVVLQPVRGPGGDEHDAGQGGGGHGEGAGADVEERSLRGAVHRAGTSAGSQLCREAR